MSGNKQHSESAPVDFETWPNEQPSPGSSPPPAATGLAPAPTPHPNKSGPAAATKGHAPANTSASPST